MVVAILMVVWMLLPVNVAVPIVAFGALLGTCCAPFIGASVQIAVAIDPALSIWAQLGNTVGQSVPVIAVCALEVTPNSSHAEICNLIAVPMVMCIFATEWLGVLRN